VTPLLCSPSGNFTFERCRHQLPPYTVTIRNDAFSRCQLLGMTFTLSRWLVLVAATIVVATWSFGLGIAGFRAHTPCWIQPAGGSKSDCGAVALFGFALY
jgi:hypothetical protein